MKTILKEENTSELENQIDQKGTISLNKENIQIEIFARSAIRNDPKAFEHSTILLYNLLEVLKLAAFQLSIVALPFSPNVLLCFLVALELTFFIVSLLPFLCWSRYISWFEFITLSIKFVSLEGFLMTCLIISGGSRRQMRPVSQDLQKIALVCIYIGVAVSYLVEFVRLVHIVYDLLAKRFSKNGGGAAAEKKKVYKNKDKNSGEKYKFSLKNTYYLVLKKNTRFDN